MRFDDSDSGLARLKGHLPAFPLQSSLVALSAVPTPTLPVKLFFFGLHFSPCDMTYFSLKVFLHSCTSWWRRLFSTANGSIRLWHAFCWTMFHRITLMASHEQSDAGRWHTKMQLWSVCFIQIRNHPPTVTALLLALQILQADSGCHSTGSSTRGQNKLLSVKNYPSCFCTHKREPRGHSDVCWCQKHHIQSCC